MSVEQTYIQAVELLDQERWEQAGQLGEQLIRKRFSGGYEVLAQSFLGRNLLDQAEKVLEQGVAIAPDLWNLWLLLGNVYSQRGKLEQAEQAYTRARSNPAADSEQVQYNQAVLALRQGRPQRASEQFEALLKTSQDGPLRLAALTQLLKLLATQDRLLEALVMLGEARLHDHDNAEILATLAETVLELGEVEEASRLMEQALALRTTPRLEALAQKIRSASS